MRDEFETCPKIVFGTFLVTFEIGGGDLKKKRCKGGYSNVSEEKFPALTLVKGTFSTFSPVFPLGPLKNL